MTDSTTDNYKQLLRTYPPEKIINASDPAYADALAYGGCLTCAQGRTRISEDIDEILLTAELPESEKLPCLQWLIAEECSSLTHSMAEMVEKLLAATVLVVKVGGSDVAMPAYDPACP